MKRITDCAKRLHECVGAVSAALARKARALTKSEAIRGRLGGYVALALLLAVLGTASGAYRARRETARSDGFQTPREVLAVQTAAPTPEPTPEPTPWLWPLEGEIIGAYAPDVPVWSATLGQWQTHPGLDIAGMPGEAVYACRDGIVADAWQDRLWGNVIAIDHGDGWRSTCAGLNTLNLVSPGDRVTAGDVISAVGRSLPCEAELPAHIHFELTKDGKPMDPAALME